MSTSPELLQEFDWAPSNPNELRFNNCNLATAFYTVKLPDADVPYTATAKFLLNGLQSYFRAQNRKEEPDYGELVAWSKEMGVQRRMRDYVLNSCRHKVCPKMRWQGNSDITGVGVSHSIAMVS